jgi:ribulose-5-phosphate 4-epimerase/fuculose-1-phosphate aldolase
MDVVFCTACLVAFEGGCPLHTAAPVDWRARTEKAEAELAVATHGQLAAERDYEEALDRAEKAEELLLMLEDKYAGVIDDTRRASARAEAAEKRAEGLERFARHADDCPANPDPESVAFAAAQGRPGACTCGLAALLALAGGKR